jgi:hypothetical protein
VTYRQQRPNPYLALQRGGIVLHYYAMPDWDFSLVDPAGNWIRVTVRASAEQASTACTGAVARAVDNAVVLADSHGDPAQAYKILSGAIRRTPQAPVTELAPALAYLAELSVRTGRADNVQAARDQLVSLPATITAERAAVGAALTELDGIDIGV